MKENSVKSKTHTAIFFDIESVQKKGWKLVKEDVKFIIYVSRSYLVQGFTFLKIV